jgi:hypothetical protein
MINDRTIDLLSRSSGALLIGAVLFVGAAIGLGMSVNSAERLFDFREWARAIGQCLRSL